jgi:hypothetical protein
MIRILSLLALLSFSTSAFALTPAEVKRSYNSCMALLKMPLAKQKAIAAKTSYSLSQVLWACHLQARHSLAYMQQQERNYQRGLNSGGGNYSGGGGASEPSDPYGGSGGGFGGAGVCTNGVCNGPGGTTVCTNGVCNGPGGTTVCTNGVCNGPGGTTVCTNGVCNGPGGTTVCTNGVCN